MKKILIWLPLIGVVSAFVVMAVGGLSGRTKFPSNPMLNAARQQEVPERIAVFSGGLWYPNRRWIRSQDDECMILKYCNT